MTTIYYIHWQQGDRSGQGRVALTREQATRAIKRAEEQDRRDGITDRRFWMEPAEEPEKEKEGE